MHLWHRCRCYSFQPGAGASAQFTHQNSLLNHVGTESVADTLNHNNCVLSERPYLLTRNATRASRSGAGGLAAIKTALSLRVQRGMLLSRMQAAITGDTTPACFALAELVHQSCGVRHARSKGKAHFVPSRACVRELLRRPLRPVRKARSATTSPCHPAAVTND